MLSLKDLQFYEAPEVERRIWDYLGGQSPASATAAYFTTHGPSLWAAFEPLPLTRLPEAMAHGCELNRSLLDQSSLLVHLDLELVNFGRPWETYVHTLETFELQQPSVLAVQQVLAACGIAPLHLLSGRGHHFVWRVERHHEVFRRLALARFAEERCGGPGVTPELARAHATVGRLMEFLCHEAIGRAEPGSRLPLRLTAVEDSSEIVSFDISEYGDPLAYRTIRVPFSVYRKAEQINARTPFAEHELPPLVMIPLHEMDVWQGLEQMRDLTRVRALARRTSVKIPEQSDGTGLLLERYLCSPLADAHAWYYAQEPHDPEDWAQTYERVPLDILPVCVRAVLQEPNDALLKPAVLKHVVRTFLALGWHPRHVAGLIHSRYASDQGWIPHLHYYDPGLRADFYTRLYACAIKTGLDSLDDFHCTGLQSAGLCIRPDCGTPLSDYRKSLDARRNHERMACRPVHGLYVPDEHL